MEPLHWRSLGERYLSMSMESILIELSEFLDFFCSFIPAFVLSPDGETGAYNSCKVLSESAAV